MIKITKDSINRATFTLTENVTLTGTTFFLFEFISDDTNKSVLFTAPDISTNIGRWNEFNITETGTTSVNLTGGTINLDGTGYWKYNVYQQTSSTNISLSGKTGEAIETGKVLVIGTELPEITEYTGQTKTNTTYYG